MGQHNLSWEDSKMPERLAECFVQADQEKPFGADGH